MKPPAFQFYPQDFLVGVMGMSDAEIGVYMKMLSVQWVKGSLPNCAKSVKNIIGSQKIPTENVMQKFTVCDDGNLRNDRLENERDKQATFRESRSKNARKRWGKEITSNARASKVHKSSICKTDALHSSSSSSFSSSDVNTPLPPKGDEGKKDRTPTTAPALRIASLFKRRPSTPWSAKEIRAFKAIGPIDTVELEKVCAYTESERAKGDKGRHRRDLSTFLNNYTGELDRANESKPANRDRNSSADFKI